MPLPPALLGPALGGPAAAAAAKHAAWVAAEYALPAVSSASLAAVLARLAWRRLPAWIREDVSFRPQQQPSSLDDGDAREMERLSSVLEKLQALVDTASAKLHVPVDHLYASLLAYVQLAAQHKRIGPEVRDAVYHSAGRQLNHHNEEEEEDGGITVERLKEALDFAVWAYYVEDETFLKEHLGPVGYTLLHHSIATRPGYVGHYTAVSHEKKILLIGIKGTSSLEDVFTDTCGRSVPYDPSEGGECGSRVEVRAKMEDEISSVGDVAVEIVSGHERIMVECGWDGGDDSHRVRCHEGIFISAKRLADQVQPRVLDMVVRQGYKLVLAGHSLGGGAASLLAVLLRSRFQDEMTGDDRIQVYAFASPPVLDHDAAVAASLYITSIVNNADIIPRSSLANLAVFLEFLRAVSARLKEQCLAPTGPKTTTAFLQMLARGAKGEPIMTVEEVQNAMDGAHRKVELRDPDHLYVPGRVLLLHKDWKCEKDCTTEDSDGDVVLDAERAQCCTLTDGTSPVLRFFEIDGYRMLGDHTCASYYMSIDALMAESTRHVELIS